MLGTSLPRAPTWVRVAAPLAGLIETRENRPRTGSSWPLAGRRAPPAIDSGVHPGESGTTGGAARLAGLIEPRENRPGTGSSCRLAGRRSPPAIDSVLHHGKSATTRSPS